MIVESVERQDDRNLRIFADVLRGATLASVAEREDLSVERVRQICSKMAMVVRHPRVPYGELENHLDGGIREWRTNAEAIIARARLSCAARDEERKRRLAAWRAEHGDDLPHEMPVERLREILDKVPDDAMIVPNRVRNLAVMVDGVMVGWINFLADHWEYIES